MNWDFRKHVMICNGVSVTYDMLLVTWYNWCGIKYENSQNNGVGEDNFLYLKLILKY